MFSNFDSRTPTLGSDNGSDNYNNMAAEAFEVNMQGALVAGYLESIWLGLLKVPCLMMLN